MRSFLSPVDARELSDCLASADDYDTDADSVDSCPTFEFLIGTLRLLRYPFWSHRKRRAQTHFHKSCGLFHTQPRFYPFQRGRWKNEALRTLLEDVVERRLLPYVRQRFGEERMALSEVLVRRFLVFGMLTSFGVRSHRTQDSKSTGKAGVTTGITLPTSMFPVSHSKGKSYVI